MGNKDGAIEAFKKALAHNPDDLENAKAIAHLLPPDRTSELTSILQKSQGRARLFSDVAAEALANQDSKILEAWTTAYAPLSSSDPLHAYYVAELMMMGQKWARSRDIAPR